MSSVLATGEKSLLATEGDFPVADTYISLQNIYKYATEGEKIILLSRKQTDETKRKISETLKGRRLSEEHCKKVSLALKGKYVGKKNGMFGKKHSEETKGKISKRLKGRPQSNEHKHKKAEARRGKPLSTEIKRKISESNVGKVSPNKGKRLSEITKLRISDSRRGKYGKENHPNWKGGISFEPYCPKFNKELKEHIRERDNHTCRLCGVKENGQKLDVHHIHYDKPNCNPDLISLCRSCNYKVNYKRDYYEVLFMNILDTRKNTRAVHGEDYEKVEGALE